MTKKLSEAFFGDKKLTEVPPSQLRKSILKLPNEENSSNQTFGSFSNPTHPNSPASRPPITVLPSSTSSPNS